MDHAVCYDFNRKYPSQIMLKSLVVVGLSGLLFCGQVFANEALGVAIDLIAKARFAEAARTLEPLAKTGNAGAQYHLGVLYYNGKGVPEDEGKAVQLLTSSARQGNVDAMYQLGNAFTFGSEAARLVQDADAEAASWYFQAAKLGSADAQYSLGLLFLAGKGLSKNEKEATYWMQQAAKNGHKDAKNYVSSRK
jgi:TPR repeat protein